MSDQLRRILLIVLFALAVIALGFLLYFFFFRATTTGPTDDPTVNDNANVGLPSVNDLIINDSADQGNTNGGLNIPSGGIADRPQPDQVEVEVLTPGANTLDPALARDGSIRYYNETDGGLYRVTPEGTEIRVGDESFPAVENVTWAPNANEAIIEFPDGSNIYYDADTNTKVTLPKEYEDFSFHPTGSQIAFKYMHIDPERRVLAVSSPDGTSARTLESLGNNAHRVQVDFSPSGKVAATYGEFIDLNRQNLGFLGLAGENFKRTVVEGSGLQSEYSPTGQQLLYSVHSVGTDYKPSLWVVDADGENIGRNRRELRINTFAHKCTYAPSGDAVYCGVPQESVFGFGLEPDILEGVPDQIYRIDVRTGAQQRVAVPRNEAGEAAYSVGQETMMVSEDESQLFFRDENTGQLIKVELQ